MSRLPVVLAVLMLVAGCASGSSSTTQSPEIAASSAVPTLVELASPGPVAWSSRTPRPFVTPAPTQIPDASACRTDQLLAGVAGWEGGTGSMLGGFLLWNTSAEPCRLTGRPSVAILDRVGHRLKVTEVRAPNSTTQPVVLPAHQPPPVRHEESQRGLASVMVQWFNWCGALPVEPLNLAITLLDGGVLRTPVVMGGIPRCDIPSADSSISVAAFEATPGAAPSEPPVVPAEALRVTLDAPDDATAGQTLHYVVTLTNPTSSTIDLRPCPAYEERINGVGGGVVADYILDCAGVPRISPGASVRFAMELDVPASLPASDGAAVVWSLDPYFTEGFAPQPPVDKVKIRIVAP